MTLHFGLKDEFLAIGFVLKIDASDANKASSGSMHLFTLISSI